MTGWLGTGFVWFVEGFCCCCCFVVVFCIGWIVFVYLVLNADWLFRSRFQLAVLGWRSGLKSLRIQFGWGGRGVCDVFTQS